MFTLYWRREFAEAGGLMSDGSGLADALRVAGAFTPVASSRSRVMRTSAIACGPVSTRGSPSR